MNYIHTETLLHEEPIPYYYRKFVHKFPVFGDVACLDDVTATWMDNPESIKGGKKSIRWDHSIFYWWFEYLRRHEGYKKYCETRQGPYAKLYQDFGNIHYTDNYFMKWFCYGGCELFSERVLPAWFEETTDPVDFVNGDKARHIAAQDTKYIYLAVPIENSRKHLLNQFDLQISKHKEPSGGGAYESNAKYPVHTFNSTPQKLRSSLMVWELRNQGLKNRKIYEQVFGKLSDEEISQSMKGEVPNAQEIDLQRSKRYQKKVKRSFDDADAMIRNVALGKFPCTD